MSQELSANAPVDALALRGTPAPAAEFLSVEAESRAFWRLRCRLARTVLRQAFSRARLRLLLILGLSLLLWLGLFWLFANGFWFLKMNIYHPEKHDKMVRDVFEMFFGALTVMLVFSSAIILYGSLFRSREIAFLLTIPARVQRVFLHKFQETLVLSSWGFLLLGSPMLVAYGIVAAAPWYYFAMLPVFMLAFVYIPAGIGALFCLAIAYKAPGNQVRVLILAGIAAIALACWFVWSLVNSPAHRVLTPDWFQEMLDRTKPSEGRLLPSWWLSTGLLEAARRVWSESVLFLVVLIANALFCRQLAVWFAGRVYRPAYCALRVAPQRRRRPVAARVDRIVFLLAGFLSRPMRLIIVKDLRLFRRDPVQWSQFLIFFGLLGLYFLNVRVFGYDMQDLGWLNMVSFLNLSVVGLLMATFTTRFIFPLVSLEGRRFWILGLLPVRRETVLWGKFLFAAGGSILPCSGLILLSDVMLRVPPMILASHQLTCMILCVGLSGIAVGLGARLPNLREQSPSRIAAGFGGTLNLTISTLYILAVVLLTAVPSHFYLAHTHLVTRHGRAAGVLSQRAAIDRWLEFWLIAGTIGSVVLGILAVVIPLRIGFKAFRRMEF
ncbi:MAG TPA: hypothetical protein VMY42_09365 [Thermoguttaceae bacterium]|nr:hypothetical protein [Thermoguttaceae bacterium]